MTADSMLLNTLNELKEGQREINRKLDEVIGEQAKLRERVATLEANQVRFVTWKHVLMTGLGSAGAAGTITTIAHRLIGG